MTLSLFIALAVGIPLVVVALGWLGFSIARAIEAWRLRRGL